MKIGNTRWEDPAQWLRHQNCYWDKISQRGGKKIKEKEKKKLSNRYHPSNFFSLHFSFEMELILAKRRDWLPKTYLLEKKNGGRKWKGSYRCGKGEEP